MKLGTINPAQDNAAGLWIEQSKKKKASVSASNGQLCTSVTISIEEWQEIKVDLILEGRRLVLSKLDPSNFYWFIKMCTELWRKSRRVSKW